ncbi:MAG: chloramphenicol acetyltransferase [Anaerolineales bacterium]
MRTIDMETWPRRDHYQFFSTFEYPHFSLCADLDITTFLPFLKNRKISFTAAIMYLIARTANSIPEFRQRVREGNPIEYDVVHPSATILTKDDLFSFCTVLYNQNFIKFVNEAEEEIVRVKTEPYIQEKIQDDSALFMTSIPWVSFTSFMHPLKLNPADSVPRFAWGKYKQTGEKTLMPLSVQAHHAVVDGLHAGRFYDQFQKLLDQPESLMIEK